ncbi:MAG TPA: hypothetical protein VKM72_21985 [Thermoanaerobaculia bacterium]|nr:hypothetical protein [Thermoanaerobaculia bacterium]
MSQKFAIRGPVASGLTAGVLAVGLLIPLSFSISKHGQSLTPERQQARDQMVAKMKGEQAERFDEPQEAVDFYWQKRSPNGQPMGVSALEEAAAEVAQMPVYSTASQSGGPSLFTSPSSTALMTDASTLSGSWQPHGPGNIGGRSRALLIHRTQNNLMWTAGVAGGIWKSTNSGASWQPKGDLLVNIAVNSIIEDPAQDNVLYAGTGEGFFNGDGVRGQGIFKSTDYGETWTQLPSTNNADFFYVQKLAATRHKTKQRIYAATRTGVFRSTDGGATWAKVLDATAVRGCMDLAIQYFQEDKQNYVFASCGTLAQGTVWRALDVDQGQTWEPVLSEVDMGRTSLAIAPSNPGVVYALASFYHLPAASPQDYALLAVYRSTQNGAAGTWQTRVHYTDSNRLNTVQLTNPVYAFLADCGFGPSNQFFNQGWYDNQIAVDPKNENIVWTAGVDTMRSDDGGQTWGVASYWWFDSTDPMYSHADNHAITFHPKYNGASNKQMFLASDGGIHRTDDARATVGTTLDSVCGAPDPSQVTWTSLNNGYQVTQFYHGAVYPDGSTFFGGTQDNGTLRGNLAGGQLWTSIRGGDGGYVAVNRDNTNILYVENTGKSLQRSVNGGASWSNIFGGVGEAAGNYQFIHPFAMDPTNSLRMWYGGASAFRSNNGGTSWSLASQFFASRIASWAISATDPNRVYVGVQNLGTTTSGRIFTTNVATTATSSTFWPSAQPRQGYVSSIGVDPVNPLIAYATYSTFNSGTNVGHVFKTTNGGATWSRIDLTLPDMPVHSVVAHPTQPATLYIGTDLGVFVTTDGGVNWLRENTGFANVVVEHLELNNGRLFAFTHGRSAWSVALN